MPTFDELLAQVTALLQRQGRVSYRALKRRFALDNDYLEDLKKVPPEFFELLPEEIVRAFEGQGS
jgi:hypothetical protein